VVTLEQVGAFVPETSISVNELREPLGLAPGEVHLFTRFMGLEKVAWAPGIDLATMLTRAGEGALRGVNRDDIRYLVHGHTMQHAAPPSERTLERVRQRLDLRNATPLGVSHQNCVIGLYSIQLARHLLLNGGTRDKVLVVTGDKILSRGTHYIPDTTIMGEAAAAFLVGHSPRGDRIVGSAMRFIGRFYQCLSCPDNLKREYKRIYLAAFVDVMRQALTNSGVLTADLAAILPHNVNRLSWKKVAHDLGIPADRVYLDNVPKLGHCFSSDPFINLATARAAGRVGPGDFVLMASAGLGAAFAATVIQLGEGTTR
jgi:3-oxoacyl-[acyl-carrier-protein] synthase III